MDIKQRFAPLLGALMLEMAHAAVWCAGQRETVRPRDLRLGALKLTV